MKLSKVMIALVVQVLLVYGLRKVEASLITGEIIISLGIARSASYVFSLAINSRVLSSCTKASVYLRSKF